LFGQTFKVELMDSLVSLNYSQLVKIPVQRLMSCVKSVQLKCSVYFLNSKVNVLIDDKRSMSHWECLNSCGRVI